MTISKYPNYNNTVSSSYLNEYDLITKLLIEDLGKEPKIGKITVLFSLKQLNENENISTDSQNSQIKGVMILYVLFGLTSRVEFRSEKNIVENHLKKNIDSHYIEKLVLDQQDDIDNFIYFLFIENDFKERGIMSPITKSKNKNSTISLTLSAPLSAFMEGADFCNFGAQNLASKELSMTINFVISNTDKLKGGDIDLIWPFWLFK